MFDKLKWGAVIALSMVLGGAVVVGVNSLDDDPAVVQTAASASPAPAAEEQPSPAPAANVSNTTVSTVADLYEEVRPSVVRINARNGGFGGGVGSGIVLDKQGHILTNNHVVGEFDAIDVVLADGTSATAEVVGRDPGNDLAVIKADVAPELLSPARLGDSDSVRAGEFVIAVGNPFDLNGSVTEGIVSGLGRRLDGGGRPLRELIQSDAAINPGNSGGALFNGAGEVIGVTTAIENPSGDRVFVGIGYAVPINLAKRFLPQMLAGETIEHPRIGIGLQDVTPSLAEALGLSVDEGVIIRSIEPGTGADAAGLRGGDNGDVIVAIDGEPIRDFDDLANYIDSKQVGDVVDISIVRDGAETTVPVTLEAWQQFG